MTIEEWAKDFKSYVNALDMQRDDCNGIIEYIDDALAIMKEQEAKPVKVDTRKILDGETDDGPIYIMDTFYRCPSCGSVFSRTNKNYDIRYCEHCGQAVKWE